MGIYVSYVNNLQFNAKIIYCRLIANFESMANFLQLNNPNQTINLGDNFVTAFLYFSCSRRHHYLLITLFLFRYLIYHFSYKQNQ